MSGAAYSRVSSVTGATPGSRSAAPGSTDRATAPSRVLRAVAIGAPSGPSAVSAEPSAPDERSAESGGVGRAGPPAPATATTPYEFKPHERPFLPGSPATPDHPMGRRIAYAAIGVLLGQLDAVTRRSVRMRESADAIAGMIAGLVLIPLVTPASNSTMSIGLGAISGIAMRCSMYCR